MDWYGDDGKLEYKNWNSLFHENRQTLKFMELTVSSLSSYGSYPTPSLFYFFRQLQASMPVIAIRIRGVK